MIVILASESASRLKLLNQIHLYPNRIIPANLDETPLNKEKAQNLSARLAQSKAEHVGLHYPEEDCLIIAADTVAEVRQNILPKAESNELVKYCLSQLSGRRARIYTSVCIIKKQGDQIIKRLKSVKTILKIKRLTDQEIQSYVESREGLNKAGGFAIEGIAGGFIEFINGSYSNIVGLPLFETRNLLLSLGFKFL